MTMFYSPEHKVSFNKLIKHIDKYYPELTDKDNLSSNLEHSYGFVPLRKLFLCKRVEAQIDTSDKTYFNINKTHFVEDNANELFSLAYIDPTDDLTLIDTKEKRYSCLYSMTGEIDTRIQENDVVLFNIPVAYLDDQNILTSGLTMNQLQTLNNRIAKDKLMQDFCQDYLSQKVTLIKDCNLLQKPIVFEESLLNEYLKVHFPELFSHKAKNGTKLGELYFGICVRANETCAGKTMLHLNKSSFVATEDRFRLFKKKPVDILNKTDSCLLDFRGNKYVPVTTYTTHINTSIRPTTKNVVYGDKLTLLSHAIDQNVVIPDNKLGELSRKIGADVNIQRIIRGYYADKISNVYIRSMSHVILPTDKNEHEDEGMIKAYSKK